MTRWIIPILISILLFGCSSPDLHVGVDAGGDASPLAYAISWTCTNNTIVVPFAYTNILTWHPEDEGGFFWLYRDTVFVAGGQIGGSLSACWELRFAGQPVSAAFACPTGAGFAGYAIYRDTIAQKESRCDFMADR